VVYPGHQWFDHQIGPVLVIAWEHQQVTSVLKSLSHILWSLFVYLVPGVLYLVVNHHCHPHVVAFVGQSLFTTPSVSHMALSTEK